MAAGLLAGTLPGRPEAHHSFGFATGALDFRGRCERIGPCERW